jgi:hypothetical protein
MIPTPPKRPELIQEHEPRLVRFYVDNCVKIAIKTGRKRTVPNDPVWDWEIIEWNHHSQDGTFMDDPGEWAKTYAGEHELEPADPADYITETARRKLLNNFVVAEEQISHIPVRSDPLPPKFSAKRCKEFVDTVCADASDTDILSQAAVVILHLAGKMDPHLIPAPMVVELDNALASFSLWERQEIVRLFVEKSYEINKRLWLDLVARTRILEPL